MDYIHEFVSIIQSLDRSKSIENVFRDFLALSTYSLAQPFYRSNEIEDKYMQIIKSYAREQAVKFSKLLAFLVEGLEQKYQDFLGQIFMELGFGNARKGQFFTPYSVSKLMAEINVGNVENIADRELITLSEPCSGSGGIIIAFAESLKEKDYNYQNKLFVEAIDIDEMCFMMTYIQLSLYGIPARVMLGDTLAYKFGQIIYTPMYFINGFSWKLKQYENKPKQQVEVINKSETLIPTQLTLF